MHLCHWLTMAVVAGALFVAGGCAEQQAVGVSRPAGATAFCRTAKLVTENYEVTITVDCAEGNVTCEDVIYRRVSRKSGKDVTFKGSTYHTYSEDGTPSRFLGYRLEEGDMQHVVPEEGWLRITRGDSEVLVDEAGVWRG